jgi:hypothetical protein
MAKNSPTPILINTDILSRLIGDVLDIAGVPASKKSACLNKAADRIAGPKHNWGALTNQDGPIVARGLSGYDVVKTAAPAQSAAPADAAPTNDTSIPPNLFPKAVHDALISNTKLLLLSGQPGTGISTLVDDLARAMDRGTYHIRTSLLLEDEMVCWDDETRLQDGLRPRGDASEITIFEDVDGLSDAGLKALLKEIYIPSRTPPAAQIVLITNFRDRFVSRLREVAPGLLNKAVSLHMDSPIHPAITEWMESKPSLGDLDFSDTVLPSMESLDKVNQILRKTNETGIGAVREANNIVCAPGGAREDMTSSPIWKTAKNSHPAWLPICGASSMPLRKVSERSKRCRRPGKMLRVLRNCSTILASLARKRARTFTPSRSDAMLMRSSDSMPQAFSATSSFNAIKI